MFSTNYTGWVWKRERPFFTFFFAITKIHEVSLRCKFSHISVTYRCISFGRWSLSLFIHKLVTIFTFFSHSATVWVCVDRTLIVLNNLQLKLHNGCVNENQKWIKMRSIVSSSWQHYSRDFNHLDECRVCLHLTINL